MNAIAMFDDETAEADEIPKGFELIDGELVEKNMGAEADWVGGELATLMRSYCRPKDLGSIFQGETGYRCFPMKPRVRKPDVSFVGKGRLPNERIPRGDFTIAPDLAVEVVSPNDTAVYIFVKIADFLSVGVRLVWLVIPDTRNVLVFRLDGTITKLGENDQLSGEDVIRGFTCRIADFLPPVSNS